MIKNSNSQKPLVSIMCLSYNHENFIGKALEGFLMQKTNFDFEIIIHDDASTDNTVTVIKNFETEYPTIIKPIFQTINQYSNKEVNIWTDFTFPACSGKYIAICEGDDYWTDPLKLQKQVDFLEQNTKYVITWTDYSNLKDGIFTTNDFGKILPYVFPIDFDNLFDPYCTLTLTSLFRKENLEINKIKNFKHSKDNTLYALALCNGKGAFLNFNSGVYRIHSGGIYSLQSAFFQKYSSYLNIKEIYDEIPQAQTPNIKNTENGLLRQTAIEVLKLKSNREKLSLEQKNVFFLYLKQSSFKVKRKFFKYYLKVRFLNSKTAQI